MPGSTLGKLFKLHTYGESHGTAIGGILEGCPPGLSLDISAIEAQLARRRPGQSDITTERREEDAPELLSGIFEGRTTGAPIGFTIQNKQAKSADYEALRDVFRPGHADKTYTAKYGLRDHRGGGRSSARETASWVIAGSIAEQWLHGFGVQVTAWVSQVGPICSDVIPSNRSDVDTYAIRCPEQAAADQMIEQIKLAKSHGDSLGGVISCRIQGCPPGLGEPVFHKLHADLAHAMMSINASRGFEIGAGFAAAAMRGSAHNRPEHAGGVLGGISNGDDITFRVAFKPASSIALEQEMEKRDGEQVHLTIQGRHDPCVVPRAVPIIEALASLVLADHLLQQMAVERSQSYS